MTKLLTIASDLGADIDALIAAHPSRPKIVPIAARPWELPAEAEILLTYGSRWKAAPATPPDNWCAALRWIQTGSVGVDAFPTWMLEAPLVTCARGVLSVPIAEFVMAAIMARTKSYVGLVATSPADWRTDPKIVQPLAPGDLEGTRLGIAGFGAIGQEVARRALAFGMEVRALTRSQPVKMPEVEAVQSLAELVVSSDHLALCLPLTPATRGIVDQAVLNAAPPGLHLINVARGALIDDVALLEALDSGQVGFATLDVTQPEPLAADHPFWTHPAVQLTPHASGLTRASNRRLAQKVLANIERYLLGEPLADRVDSLRGY